MASRRKFNKKIPSFAWIFVKLTLPAIVRDGCCKPTNSKVMVIPLPFNVLLFTSTCYPTVFVTTQVTGTLA